MTRQDKLLEALKKGETLTAKQISNRFKIAHPGSAVRNLRSKGYAVYSNTTTNSKGIEKVKYRIGTPSREMVAAAYRAGVFAGN